MTKQEWAAFKAEIEWHTPGPWDVESGDGDNRPSFRPWVGNLLTCHYAALASGNCRKEADANAALIAAAPTLVAEVERLREALAFYADLDGYGYHAAATDYGLSMELGDIIEDGGQRARTALTGSSQ